MALPIHIAMKLRDIQTLLVIIKPTSACNQIRNKSHTDETRHWIIYEIIWAILLVVCILLPPNHLIPTEKLLLMLFSRCDVVCLCIHWVVQNIKHHPFLIHAGSVYTICVLFLFFLSLTYASRTNKKCPLQSNRQRSADETSFVRQC